MKYFNDPKTAWMKPSPKPSVPRGQIMLSVDALAINKLSVGQTLRIAGDRMGYPDPNLSVTCIVVQSQPSVGNLGIHRCAMNPTDLESLLWDEGEPVHLVLAEAAELPDDEEESVVSELDQVIGMLEGIRDRLKKR